MVVLEIAFAILRRRIFFNKRVSTEQFGASCGCLFPNQNIYFVKTLMAQYSYGFCHSLADGYIKKYDSAIGQTQNGKCMHVPMLSIECTSWQKSHLLSTSLVKAGHTRHPNLCCKFLKIAHLTNKKSPKNSTSPGTDAAFLCECPANWIAIFGTTLGRYYQAKQFSNQHHQLVTMRFKDFFSNVLKLN